jgi:hypothetical protein
MLLPAETLGRTSIRGPAWSGRGWEGQGAYCRVWAGGAEDSVCGGQYDVAIRNRDLMCGWVGK